MKTIRSKDNPTYKSAVKLTKKKYRDETGRYLLEGIKPLRDALSVKISIECIFLCDGMKIPEGIPETLLTILDGKLFQSLSDTVTSQGIIAIAEKNLCMPEDFVKKVAADDGNIIVMDRLQDPGNIGTIIRTAEAAGYEGIIMVAGSGDVYGPKVVRAASGSLFRIPVVMAQSAAHAAEIAGKAGKKLVVTSLEAEMDCFEADLTKRIALVIGNEGQGVSETFLRLSDLKIKIPMEGSIESLNAAVAAGVLMYQSQKNK